jgi:hypothetical protein
MMIGGIHGLDDRGEVVDGLGDREVGDEIRVLAQRLHLDLEPRVGRGQDLEAADAYIDPTWFRRLFAQDSRGGSPG